jgi:hypothetical protein
LAVDTPVGLDAVLRTRGLLLVVDGYNVTKTAWSDASPEEQRTRVLAALAELHLRLRCDIVTAFDGADVRGVPLPRRPGVRVVFSAAGEEADDVVVREAAAPPRTVPVVSRRATPPCRRAEAENGDRRPATLLACSAARRPPVTPGGAPGRRCHTLRTCTAAGDDGTTGAGTRAS